MKKRVKQASNTQGDRRFPSDRSGFSLTEVLVAMVILSAGLLGTLSSFQWAQRGLQEGDTGTRALALAESKLELKRHAPWQHLLDDDLDGDGTFDATMVDTGSQGDERAGDGIFSGMSKEGDIKLVWTVEPDRPGPLWLVGAAVLGVQARYEVGEGRWREIRCAALRANPNYVGVR
jgi:prepilin-type N-terminal cleavage/methylation domain-containing protein